MPIRLKPIRIMPIHWKLCRRMPIRRIPIHRMSICRKGNRKLSSFLLFYLTMNEQWYSVSILYYCCYSLFRRIGSISYLSRMQKMEKKKVCVQYSLIWNIDVTLRRRLRKLYVYARTAQYLLVHHFIWRGTWLPSNGHSYFNIINVIPILSNPYLPEIKNVEYNSISIPYSRFLNKHLI